MVADRDRQDERAAEREETRSPWLVEAAGSPTRGTPRWPQPPYAPAVDWLVAVALVAQLVAVIMTVWRNPHDPTV